MQLLAISPADYAHGSANSSIEILVDARSKCIRHIQLFFGVDLAFVGDGGQWDKLSAH